MSTPAERAAQEERVANNLGLVRCVLDPEFSPAVAPPNFGHNSTFSKQLQVSGNIEVKAGALVGEQIPVTEGMLLWLVNRGMDSFWRMGFVPAATVSTYLTNLTLVPALRRAFESGAQSFAGFTGLTYNTQLALPYNSSAERITVQSQLAKDFSRTRAFAGVMAAKSSTQQVGSVILNGNMSAGSVADTRDVCQDTETKLAFAAQDVATKSVTPKDGIVQCDVVQGISMLSGPDISPHFSAPSQDSVDVVHGEWIVRNVPVAGTILVGGVNASGFAGTVTPLISLFVSPWDVTPSFGAIANKQFIKVPAINECGVLDIDLHCYLSPFRNNSNNPNTFTVYATACHYFAQASETGAIVYSNHFERVELDTRSVREWTLGADPNRLAAIDAIAKFRPKSFATGFNTVGKYIGSDVEVYARVLDGESAVDPLVTCGIALGGSYVNAHIRARNILKDGEIGPARIMRWENLGTGQVLQVSGAINIECIPQGNIASYTQGLAMHQKASQDLNIFPMLAEIFDGPTMTRRVWKGDEYERMRTSFLPSLSPATLLHVAGLNDTQLGASMEAGGLFSSIGGMLGGPVGGLLGGAGDAIFGTSGGFDSAGQFGYQSGGQYQSAAPFNSAGQFGYTSSGPFRSSGQFRQRE